MTPTFRTITLTRRSDNKTLTLPVVMGEISADVGGARDYVPAPYLREDAYDVAREFLHGANIEQHMQYLFVDGEGITACDSDDYSYVLA